MPLKGLTKDGQLIDAGAEGAAYTVDMAEPGADKYIESIRRKHQIEAVNAGAAHQAVEGVAVPVSIDDTQSPEDKAKELRDQGLVPPADAVLTSDGIKSQSEVGDSGMGVDTSKAPGEGSADNSASSSNGDKVAPNTNTAPNANQTAEELTDEQREIIDSVGEPTARALFKAGLKTREAILGKSKTQLIALPGIGPASADNIRAALQ